MKFVEIKAFVLYQTNNDVDDLGDFVPYLDDYINEAYDKVVHAWANMHLGDTTWYPLNFDSDEPDTPAWTHLAIANWATWLVYRNGNEAKQRRGLAFKSAAEDTINQIRAMGGKAGADAITAGSLHYGQFKNIPFHPYGAEGVPGTFNPYR